MISVWTRRAALALVCGGAVLLPACGSSSVYRAIKPARFISVGDGFADVGQNGYRFTINDGTLNWTQQLAANYGLTLTSSTEGGWSYAQGYAHVATPDTTSGANAPSVQSQIDTMLARVTFADTDIVLVGGGIADIVDAVAATGISSDTTRTVQAAGAALGGQVNRLVNAGAKYVVVAGVYDLGISPWGRALNQDKAIKDLTDAYNTALKQAIVKLGNNVLFVDPALFFNLVYNGKYVSNVNDPVCTTPDATTCTSSTLVSGADPAQYLFADSLYFTPAAQRMFASDNYDRNAYTTLRDRW
ncbi:MAG: GDSL family lipase [Burkholderiaceae bacterium]|jgi:phospholipase/lecithinase/hemolysin|nr:GDSL family lipase [Burkholderiaceae bacterium]